MNNIGLPLLGTSSQSYPGAVGPETTCQSPGATLALSAICLLVPLFAAPLALLAYPVLFVLFRGPYSIPIMLVSWAGFFSLLNSTKYPESDLLYYLEIYDDLGLESLSNVFSYTALSLRGTEAVYSLYSYLVAMISGRSKIAYVVITSLLIYLFAMLAICLAFLHTIQRDSHDRLKGSALLIKAPYVTGFLVATTLGTFVAITFSLSGHLIRQYLAASVLLLGLALLLFTEKRRATGITLIAIAPFIHNSSAIMSVVSVAVYIFKNNRLALWCIVGGSILIIAYGIDSLSGFDFAVNEMVLSMDEGTVHPAIMATDLALLMLAIWLNSTESDPRAKQRMNVILWSVGIFALFLIFVRQIPFYFLRYYFYVEVFRVLIIGCICGRYAKAIGPAILTSVGLLSLVYFTVRFNASPWDYVTSMPAALFTDIHSMAERIGRVYDGL